MSEWIAVEDRLPEHDEEVAARFVVDDTEAVRIAWHEVDGRWFDEWGHVLPVTHWFPLPPAEEPREVVEPKSAVGLAVEELRRREVVEPAPAPVRWLCEGCKRSVPGYRVRGGPPTEHWHWNEGDSMAMYTCGPCVPATDAQPAGAAVGEAGS